MHILNTRPKTRADKLSQVLLQQGHTVSHLPLIELQPLVLSSAEVDCLKQISGVDVVIVVSPSAAQLGINALHQALAIAPQVMQSNADNVAFKQAISQVQWIAVGTGTQMVLAQAGINAQCPIIENSEGVLALELIKQLQAGQTVMFWQGKGGRDLLHTRLIAQDIQLTPICLYQRVKPLQLTADWQQLLQTKGQPDVVLITSQLTWQHWQQLNVTTLVLNLKENVVTLANEKSVMPKYLVLGERLLAIIQRETQGINACLLLDNLQPEHVVSKL